MARDMSEWQPIATAPKDRPIFVVGGRYSQLGGANNEPLATPLVVQWCTDYDGRWQDVLGTDYAYAFYGAENQPTHWAEIPAIKRQRRGAEIKRLRAIEDQARAMKEIWMGGEPQSSEAFSRYVNGLFSMID